MIQHRTKRAIYVVLLCVALAASAFSIYTQFAKDSTTAQLATQVSQACAENRPLAIAQGLDCDKANDVKDNTPVVIEGPKGDQGERGFTGAQGDAGMSGRDGIAGQQGVTGQAGQTGATGEPGKEGPEGAQGPQGEQGPKGERGADGEPGAPAPYIVDVTFSNATGTCLATFTFNEGNPISSEVNPLMCVGA